MNLLKSTLLIISLCFIVTKSIAFIDYSTFTEDKKKFSSANFSQDLQNMDFIAQSQLRSFYKYIKMNHSVAIKAKPALSFFVEAYELNQQSLEQLKKFIESKELYIEDLTSSFSSGAWEVGVFIDTPHHLQIIDTFLREKISRAIMLKSLNDFRALLKDWYHEDTNYNLLSVLSAYLQAQDTTARAIYLESNAICRSREIGCSKEKKRLSSMIHSALYGERKMYDEVNKATTQVVDYSPKSWEEGMLLSDAYNLSSVFHQIDFLSTEELLSALEAPNKIQLISEYRQAIYDKTSKATGVSVSYFAELFKMSARLSELNIALDYYNKNTSLNEENHVDQSQYVDDTIENSLGDLLYTLGYFYKQKQDELVDGVRK